jgi:hypothetical protein
MPCVRFKPTIPASERAKRVHALDRSATVTGGTVLYHFDIARTTGVQFQIPTFIFATSSRSAVGPTRPFIQWEPREILGVQSGRNMNLATHFHPTLRLRMPHILPLLSLYSLLAWILATL